MGSHSSIRRPLGAFVSIWRFRKIAHQTVKTIVPHRQIEVNIIDESQRAAACPCFKGRTPPRLPGPWPDGPGKTPIRSLRSLTGVFGDGLRNLVG